MTDEPQVPPPPSEPPAADPPPPPSGPPSDPPSSASSSTGGGSENRTLWLVLSYVWILALIPFLVEQRDKEVQWHAKHGLVLTGAEILLWIVLSVVNMTAGCLGCVLYPIILIGVVVFRILCITKALNGERFLIPGLSEFADRF